jgi:hypothetical protein
VSPEIEFWLDSDGKIPTLFYITSSSGDFELTLAFPSVERREIRPKSISAVCNSVHRIVHFHITVELLLIFYIHCYFKITVVKTDARSLMN